MKYMAYCALVCMVFIAAVNSLNIGTYGNIYSTAGRKPQKENLKEMVATLSQVCERCSKFQNACMKLKELKTEIKRLPSKEPKQPAEPPKMTASKEANKETSESIDKVMSDFPNIQA